MQRGKLGGYFKSPMSHGLEMEVNRQTRDTCWRQKE